MQQDRAAQMPKGEKPQKSHSLLAETSCTKQQDKSGGVVENSVK